MGAIQQDRPCAAGTYAQIPDVLTIPYAKLKFCLQPQDTAAAGSSKNLGAPGLHRATYSSQGLKRNIRCSSQPRPCKVEKLLHVWGVKSCALPCGCWLVLLTLVMNSLNVVTNVVARVKSDVMKDSPVLACPTKHNTFSKAVRKESLGARSGAANTGSPHDAILHLQEEYNLLSPCELPQASWMS